MTDEIELIHSPLSQIYEADGHRLQIQIYRTPTTQWVLEVVDEAGISTVWDELFDADKAALECAFLAIEKEGVAQFLADASQAAKAAEPELLRKLKQHSPTSKRPSNVRAVSAHDLTQPLSEKELQELEHLLLALDSDESMLLETLDGFLHAIAIGPEAVMPSQWLPLVWGGEGMMPPVESKETLEHLLGLVMRHYNSIIQGFEQTPRSAAPIWASTQYVDGIFEDAEMWAYGFSEGVALTRAAWQPLLNDPQGISAYRPIGLLGEENFSADQDKLTRTPAQRQTLAQQIPDALLNIHAFWLPHRHAMIALSQVRRLSPKIGRNDPCSCGSGKKFKKCCGASS